MKKRNNFLEIVICTIFILFLGIISISAQNSVRSSNRSDNNTTNRNNAVSRSTETNRNGRTKTVRTNEVRSSSTKNVRSDFERKNVRTSTNNKKLKAERVTPSVNYAKMPIRGKEVSRSKATKKAQFIKHGNTPYYYKHGIFYRHQNDKYYVSKAPVGIRVAMLPDCRVVWVNNVRYFYYFGSFYKYMDSAKNYEVVLPPIGAIVESIPEGYEKIQIDGDTYYIVDGVQYKAVIYDGEIWYEVLKILD